MTDIFFDSTSSTSVNPGTLTVFFWGKDSQNSLMFEETVDTGDWIEYDDDARWVAHLGGLENFYHDLDGTGEWHIEIQNYGGRAIVHTSADTTMHVAFGFVPEVGSA